VTSNCIFQHNWRHWCRPSYKLSYARRGRCVGYTSIYLLGKLTVCYLPSASPQSYLDLLGFRSVIYKPSTPLWLAYTYHDIREFRRKDSISRVRRFNLDVKQMHWTFANMYLYVTVDTKMTSTSDGQLWPMIRVLSAFDFGIRNSQQSIQPRSLQRPNMIIYSRGSALRTYIYCLLLGDPSLFPTRRIEHIRKARRINCVSYRPPEFSVIQHDQLRIRTHQPVPQEKGM
jgi:hypothetical protein